jgi:hypothetical protein
MQFDFEGAQLQVTIDAPAAFTVSRDRVEDYGTAFTRVGVNLHLASSGKISMRFKKVNSK